MSSMKMVNIYPKQAGADSLRNNATHLLSMAINWQQLSNYMWTAGSKYIARNIIKCSWNQFETQTPYPFSSKTLSTWFYLVTIGNPQIISFHLALLNFRFTTKKTVTFVPFVSCATTSFAAFVQFASSCTGSLPFLSALHSRSLKTVSRVNGNLSSAE